MAPKDHKRLDCSADDPLPDHAESIIPDPHDKPGVLVVDDDDLVRSVVQLGLDRNGFDVWLAANGREAIQLYHNHRNHIAVVLLDVCMIGMDGPQTLDALREVNPNVLACFMSGNIGDYDLDKLRNRGAASFIAKPFQLNQLALLLRRVVQEHPAAPVTSGSGQS